jgi:hypothetical protein
VNIISRRTKPKTVVKREPEPSLMEDPVTVVTKETPISPEVTVEEKTLIVESPEISGVEKREVEPKKTPKRKETDMVKVKVLIGTLSSVDGTYEKGETFEIAKKELAKFDSRYYQIL